MHLHPCWWSWSTLSISSTWLHCATLVSHNLECYPDDVSRDVSHENMDWPTELIMAQHTHTHTWTGGTPKSPAVVRPLHASFCCVPIWGYIHAFKHIHCWHKHTPHTHHTAHTPPAHHTYNPWNRHAYLLINSAPQPLSFLTPVRAELC